MVQPPQPGDASYATYQAERDGILASLRRRAQMLSAALNGLEGVSCNSIDGALYAFPTVTLPGEDSGQCNLLSVFCSSEVWSVWVLVSLHQPHIRITVLI